MSASINTVNTTMEKAKELFKDPVNTARWGMRFKLAPPALGNPPENFFIGFQTVDFPQEVITYLEERICGFEMSWVGEVSRKGEISATNFVSEKMEDLEYIARWINLMGKQKKGATTKKSVKTKELEAVLDIFLMDEEGNRLLSMDLEYCKPNPLQGFSGTATPALLASGLNLKFDNFVRIFG
jgi:hypothetical protein